MMNKGSIPQQSAISEPQRLEELWIGGRDSLRYHGIIVRRQVYVFVISTDETFVPFANDPSLASSEKGGREKGE